VSAMGTPLRVAGFLGLLAVVLAAGLGVGRAVGPIEVESAAHGDGHAAEPATTGAARAAGLESTSAGYTLHLVDAQLDAGPATLRFHVRGPDGSAVTSYDVQHDKELHLIVVRRDLTGFQHVHPVRAADGTWSVDVDLTPGVWRVLADTAPADGEPVVLGADLTVPGDLVPQPLGAQSLRASVDGYDVTLGGLLRAGTGTELALTVARGGEPVTDLEPYLGAAGHLVALRAGDLGYLHVHPEEDGGSGPVVRFHTAFPSPGTYRLFLDFQHGGVVRTAVFTVEVEGGTAQEGASHEH